MPTYIQSYRGTVDSGTITEPSAVTYDPSLRGGVDTTITEPAVTPTFGASGRGTVITTIGSAKQYNVWTVSGGVRVPLLIRTDRTTHDYTFAPGDRDPAGIVGAGIIRPMPTVEITSITGNVDADGWVRDKVINANLSPVTTIEGFENCVFRGNPNWTSNGWLLSGVNASAAHPVKAYWSTFEPQTPSAYANCIGPRFVEAYYCELRNSTDLISAFNDTAGSGPIGIKFINSWAHTMVRWAPDYATNNRPDTHNDAIQIQGGNGAVDDVLINGSRLDAQHHPTLGNPPSGSDPVDLSCIMMNFGVGGKVSVVTIKNSWLTGGIATVNGGDDQVTAGSLLTMDNVIVEVRNGSIPRWSLLLDTRLSRSITNVRYPDGTPAVITAG